MTDLSVADRRLIRWLKVSMVAGICLLITGHLVLSATFLNDAIDHRGYILGAAMSAIGVILSLPTKIYLTILLMDYEEASKEAVKAETKSVKPSCKDSTSVS